MAEDKARAFGLAGCSLALLYYSYEIYAYATHWDSRSDIKRTTQCGQIYDLELWLLTQNILWISSILMLMAVLLKPSFYRLLLCFLYVMGPVYLMWSAAATWFYWNFVACCKNHLDGCVNYYPFTNASSFFALLVISIVFSALISVYLLVIVGAVFWRYIERWLHQYSTLLM